jgi:hypothetical protein
MVAVLITYGILLLIYFALSRLDRVSSWMDEAEFEEEDAPQREDEEYKWSDNIKGYKHEED